MNGVLVGEIVKLFSSIPKLTCHFTNLTHVLNTKAVNSVPNLSNRVKEYSVLSYYRSLKHQYDSGVDSAFNRNEYQEYFLGVKAAGA
jgi:hypothetical protein